MLLQKQLLQNSKGGKEFGGFLMHSGCTTRGDPGGGKWNYDLPQMLQVQERSKIISDVSG